MPAAVHPLLAAALWAAGCWPLWGWYAGRLADAPDQAWLLLAPATAVALTIRPGPALPADAPFRRWLPAILLMIAYAGAYSRLPPTLRAVLALAALLAVPGPWRRDAWPDPAIAGLCVIGLPGVAMLQFYFGYPLRAAAAALAAPILRGAGFGVAREGVLLVWDGAPVAVDAACSGIRMGWAALYIALAAAGLAGLGWIRTAAVVAGAAALAVAVNALRVAALFGVEAAGFGGRPVLHAGLGTLLFVLLAAGVAGLAVRLKGRAP